MYEPQLRRIVSLSVELTPGTHTGAPVIIGPWAIGGSAVKITVCELHDDGSFTEQAWRELISHVGTTHTDLLLLPEMPFCARFTQLPKFDPIVWGQAIEAHDR